MSIRGLVLCTIFTGTRLDTGRTMNMRDLVLYTIFTGTRLDMGRVVSIRDLVLHTISITGTRSDLVLCTITGTRLDMDRAVSMRDLVLHTITGVRLDMGRATSVTRYPGWARCPPGCGRCHWWGQRSSVTGTAGQCQSEMTPYVIIITIVTTTLLRTTLCLLVLGAQSTKCKHWLQHPSSNHRHDRLCHMSLALSLKWQ